MRFSPILSPEDPGRVERFAPGRYHAAMRYVLILSSLMVFLGCGGGAARPPSVRPNSTGPGFARVHTFEPSGNPGVMETGVKGDWVLENDQMRVVVSGIGLRLGGGLHAGHVIDAAPRGGADLLGEIVAGFDPGSGSQAVYDSVTTGAGGTSLIVTGKDSQRAALRMTTTYTLAPKASFLGIRTQLVNTGADSLHGLQLGDRIRWGRATAFGPGVGQDLAGKSPLVPFLLGYGEGTAYAWVSGEAELSGPHGDSWSAPVLRTVSLAPGDSTTYTRKLYVAPSVGSIAGSAWRDRNVTGLGDLVLNVEGKDDHDVLGGTVDIRNGDGTPILAGEISASPMTWTLPAGEMTIEVRHPERGVASSGKISVSEVKSRSVTLHLPEPATAVLQSKDGNGNPCPARWTFEGVGDTPHPDFGPRYRITGAGRYHFTPRGKARVQVPPGRYRITATRGPAYQAWTTEVSLSAGQETELDARLERLEIPLGWVAADLHVYAAPGDDSPVSLADRAEELVCEGIEWFVSGDALHRTSYASVLDTLHVAAPLHALVGEEVVSKNGRFEAFPLPYRPNLLGNGALEPERLSLDAVFDGLHGEGDSVLIQVDHPRAAPGAYLDVFEYSAREDTARAGFRRDFDLIELLSGKQTPGFSALWDDWMTLLRGDSPVTAVGNSDSHSLYGDEAGVPRTYVALEPSSEPNPLAKFLEGVRLGRIVVSNGPFIEFTLGGVPVGGTLTAKGVIRGHVRVIAPSWVDVKRVRVFLNGREEAAYMLRGRSRSVRFDEDIELTVKGPSWVVVRVEGDDPMDPVVTGFGTSPRVSPLAFTNPIWVKTEAGN
jgi:hypothetical protein